MACLFPSHYMEDKVSATPLDGPAPPEDRAGQPGRLTITPIIPTHSQIQQAAESRHD
jgi:hypothetical protein